MTAEQVVVIMDYAKSLLGADLRLWDGLSSAVSQHRWGEVARERLEEAWRVARWWRPPPPPFARPRSRWHRISISPAGVMKTLCGKASRTPSQIEHPMKELRSAMDAPATDRCVLCERKARVSEEDEP